MPTAPSASSPAPARVPGLTAWATGLSLVAALALGLIAWTFRVREQNLRLRLDMAETETRLLRAELHAAHNQLEAERLLAAAQSRILQAHPSAPPPAAPPGLPSSAP
jgi:hypothetical protein